jgi:protein-tyrosine phosphatase
MAAVQRAYCIGSPLFSLSLLVQFIPLSPFYFTFLLLFMAPQPYKLLFVCLGNICRSPSAEGIMNHLIQQRGLQGQIVCDSAGTSSYHIGSPPDRRMTAAAAARQITLEGKARQFQRSDFEEFDLILVMDKDNYEDILWLDRGGEYTHKVKLMCDFCRHHRDREVPDPYYGGEAGFTYVIDLLLDACEGLLDHVQQTYLAG